MSRSGSKNGAVGLLSSELAPSERRARSTQVEIAAEEGEQARVIHALRRTGCDAIAARVEKCQRHRRSRRPSGWPYRCRSVLCWACRRARFAATVRSALAWATEGGSTASVALVLSERRGTSLPTESMRLRARLRRIRDANAGRSPNYRDVAMMGMITSGVAVVVIRHVGVSTSQIEQTVIHPMNGRIVSIGAVRTMRWPLDPADAVAVALAGRGIERMRFWIGPRRPTAGRRPSDWEDEPMPILIV